MFSTRYFTEQTQFGQEKKNTTQTSNLDSALQTNFAQQGHT